MSHHLLRTLEESSSICSLVRSFSGILDWNYLARQGLHTCSVIPLAIVRAVSSRGPQTLEQISVEVASNTSQPSLAWWVRENRLPFRVCISISGIPFVCTYRYRYVQQYIFYSIGCMSLYHIRANGMFYCL